MTDKFFYRGIVYCGALAIAFSLATISCSKSDENAQNPAAQQVIPQVPVMTVELGSTELSTSYPTTLEGINDIVITPQVAGDITQVLVDEGQQVTKGQTLFMLDQVTFQAAVSQAEAAVSAAEEAVTAAQANVASAQANVASAQAAVSIAQTNERSQKIMYDKGIYSQITWQMAADQLAQAQAGLGAAKAGLSQAQAALSQAQAGKEQAVAALTAAKKNLSYTVITAPSDGVVGTIPFREGSYVTMQSKLTTISDNKQMIARISLNENEIISMTDNGARSLSAALATIPPVQLLLSNGSMYNLNGKLATVSGVINSGTGTAQVRAIFPNPNGMLLSGASGSVLVPRWYRDVIIIPQSATFENQDMRMVYLVNDSNMTVPTNITVAKLSDGKNFVVTKGLTPGQRIVVDGVNTIVRGRMPIKPVEDGAPQQIGGTAATAVQQPAAEPQKKADNQQTTKAK